MNMLLSMSSETSADSGRFMPAPDPRTETLRASSRDPPSALVFASPAWAGRPVWKPLTKRLTLTARALGKGHERPDVRHGRPARGALEDLKWPAEEAANAQHSGAAAKSVWSKRQNMCGQHLKLCAGAPLACRFGVS